MSKTKRQFKAHWECEHCDTQGTTDPISAGNKAALVAFLDHNIKSSECKKDELSIRTEELTNA